MTDAERDSMRERRILWPRNDGTAHVFEIPERTGYQLKKYVKEWIGTCTTGEFYLGHNVLCFYSAKDAMSFTLFDAMEKCKVEYALKKEQAIA